jgi:predicted phosphodiesterase
MTFKFSLLSDLHVDHPQPKTPYADLEEWVIVAGDTSNGLLGTKFLNKLKNKGHKVFAVDGNHEHYSNRTQGRTPAQTEAQFYAGIEQNNIVPVAEGLTIIGCNGWYLVDDEALWDNYMNDRRNGDLTAAFVNLKALEQANFVREALLSTEGKVIVVTHTAPCLDTLNPEYDGHYSNKWYWNPLMHPLPNEFADKIAVWVHGHTHAPADKIVGGVRVVCNPRGYPSENPGWKPLTIEIEV